LSRALQEDIGSGDITSVAIIPASGKSRAVLLANQDLILAGMPFAERVFKLTCSSVIFRHLKKDGDSVKKGAFIARMTGDTRGLLSGERTALNMLQRLSGIATLTSRFLHRIKGLPVKIADTRKTSPGLRFFEKYAVKTGGGINHRFGLFDGILIKDNHIAAAGGIKEAVKLVREKAPERFKVEVETGNMKEVKNALSAGADVIMLDNMSIDKIIRAVKLVRSHSPRTIIEVSGNINLHNIRTVARAGVDLISIGALTHSATAVDISMDIL
jgi:nicotinate-nucleotide pyrophosphorylase (carboxylating)